MAEVKQCPRCAAEIPLGLTTCPSCGARFAVVEQGYCLSCHRVVETGGSSECPACGSAVIDRRPVSTVVEESAAPAPVVQAAVAGRRARAGEGTTLVLRLQPTYAMPSICVACGRPAGSATVSASGVSYSGRQRLSLHLPLCEECAGARRVGRRYQVLAGLTGVLAGLLLAFPILWGVPGIPLYFLGVAAAGGLAVAVVLGMVAWRRESPAVRTAYGLVNRAATVVFVLGGAIVTFANGDFAREFRALNEAAVVGE